MEQFLGLHEHGIVHLRSTLARALQNIERAQTAQQLDAACAGYGPDKLVVAVVAFAALAAASTSSPPPAKAQPHMILILIDDMGYNDFYDSSDLSPAWPEVTKLADAGVKVNQFYTHPLCTPTRSAILTGRNTNYLGLQDGVLQPFENYSMPTDVPTLPEKLHDEGYRNYLVGKWHLGYYTNDTTPQGRGFDHFYGMYCGGADHYTHQDEDVYHTLDDIGVIDFHNMWEVLYHTNGTYASFLYDQEAKRVTTEHKEQYPDTPFFMYYSMQTLHTPIQAPAEYEQADECKGVTNSVRKTFCGMARISDEAIGNITKHISETFEGDDIIFFIHGDNGGLVGKTPYAEGSGGGNNWPLRGQKSLPFEGGIRNTLIIYSPSNNIPDNMIGQIYDNGIIHVLDIHATLLSLAGGKVESDTDGYDMSRVIAENQTSPRTEFLTTVQQCFDHDMENCIPSEYNGMMYAVAVMRVGDYKVMEMVVNDDWYPIPDYGDDLPEAEEYTRTPQFWLFNIKEDPTETTNLYNTSDEMNVIFNSIKAKIKEHHGNSRFPPEHTRYDQPGMDQATNIKATVPWDSATTETVPKAAESVSVGDLIVQYVATILNISTGEEDSGEPMPGFGQFLMRIMIRNAVGSLLFDSEDDHVESTNPPPEESASPPPNSPRPPNSPPSTSSVSSDSPPEGDLVHFDDSDSVDSVTWRNYEGVVCKDVDDDGVHSGQGEDSGSYDEYTLDDCTLDRCKSKCINKLGDSCYAVEFKEKNCNCQIFYDSVNAYKKKNGKTCSVNTKVQSGELYMVESSSADAVTSANSQTAMDNASSLFVIMGVVALCVMVGVFVVKQLRAKEKADAEYVKLLSSSADAELAAI
jgi:arylsulfatase A-like enzyme